MGGECQHTFILGQKIIVCRSRFLHKTGRIINSTYFSLYRAIKSVVSYLESAVPRVGDGYRRVAHGNRQCP